MAFPLLNPATSVGSGVPTDALFTVSAGSNGPYAVQAPPQDGQTYLDVSSGILYVRYQGSWHSLGTQAAPAFVAPTLGAVVESTPRGGGLVDLGATALFGGATGGTINAVAIPLSVGQTVSKLTFVSGATAANGPTHQWAGVMNSARSVLAVSADGTNAAVAADSPVTFTMGTPVQITTRDTFYAFLMFTASTAVPSFMGQQEAAGRVGAATLAPVSAGTSSTAQTVPPALAAVLTALTVAVVRPYVAVS